MNEGTLLVLALTLFVGVIIPQILRRFDLSFVTSIVLVGALFGPFGLGIVVPDPTMEFFGFVGAAFQMLLVGMEAETMNMREDRRTLGTLFSANALIPLGVGTGITKAFGYPWDTALFMGVVYAASSLLVVFSQVEQLRIEGTRLGRTTKSLVVLTDLAAACAVYLLFKQRLPDGRFSLPILLGLLVSSVIVLRMFLPEVLRFLFSRFSGTSSRHEPELRLVISILLFILLMYSALDVSPVVAAFLVGFSLSESPDTELIRPKLETIAYSLFIPIYFFIVGVHLDLGTTAGADLGNAVLLVTVVSMVGIKAATGYVGGRGAGFSPAESMVLGLSSTTKLGFAISFAFAARALGLIDGVLYTAVVLVAVVTTVINPVAMRWLRAGVSGRA
jgi:Kef-type K+ transport system membrane component KefB